MWRRAVRPSRGVPYGRESITGQPIRSALDPSLQDEVEEIEVARIDAVVDDADTPTYPVADPPTAAGWRDAYSHASHLWVEVKQRRAALVETGRVSTVVCRLAGKQIDGLAAIWEHAPS